MKNHQELKIKRGKLKKETDIFPTRVKDPPHKKTVDPNKTITVFLKIKQIQVLSQQYFFMRVALIKCRILL